MKTVQVLDCTLRDGGYINLWNFGKEKINDIISALIEANIDYIECGYLNDDIDENQCDLTQFKNEMQIKNTIPTMNAISRLLVMIDFGKFDVHNLPNREDSYIYGIRLAFHKGDLYKIKKTCKIIIDKGYNLFLQPMATISYSENELINLIQLANEVRPYAFYIVDSFGSIKKNGLQRILNLVETNLYKDIILGFHSHNNLQLAYSNSQLVAQLDVDRRIIIDSSIFGMGRGAGNLNTELFVEYLNDYHSGKYHIKPLLRVIDCTLTSTYNEKYWGYTLAHYISAIYDCHPNYATYLSEKNSLFSDDIENIISQIDDEHKIYYSEKYAEQKYLEYMHKQQNETWNEIFHIFNGKKVLMLGPGRSTLEQRKRIESLISDENIIVVSINCFFDWMRKQDYIFVSNKRRFERIPIECRNKAIITTNIESNDVKYRVLFERLQNQEKDVEDNAGLMFIKLMIEVGADKIYISGIDGFVYDMDENYYNEEMRFLLNRKRMNNINWGMKHMIEIYAKEIEICFLKQPKFMLEEL